MAKDRFYPKKPHVNVARQRLQLVGMSMAGVDQVLNGRPVLRMEDCQLLSQIVLEAASQNGFEALHASTGGVSADLSDWQGHYGN